MGRKKPAEEKLYETWLNIWYADKLNIDLLKDLEFQVKEMRVHARRTKKLLGQAAGHYHSLYGEDPSPVRSRLAEKKQT